MDEKNKTEMMEIALQVILFAGNARDLVSKALSAAYDENFTEAKNLLSEAEDEARKAHRIQTEIVQSEANGAEIEFSFLVTHAQDTLMVSLSEINIAKQLLKMYQKIYESK
jgi:cellobiose-specific phosphotransferase system component IIA